MHVAHTRQHSRRKLADLLFGLRTLGLGLAIRAALYPLRRAYLEAKFAGPQPRGSVLTALTGLLSAIGPSRAHDPIDAQRLTRPGHVLSYSQTSSAIVLQCENAALQLTALAPEVWRVRMSRNRSFAPLDSYALAKGDNESPVAPLQCVEGANAVVARSASLTCNINKRPCRLSFTDSDGYAVFAESSGMGWLGPCLTHARRLVDDEHIYGLGEKAFPLNRRGQQFAVWNQDPQQYEPGADPIYLNVPFYLSLARERCFGLFYDNTYRSYFDVGHHHGDELVYCADDGELCYYLFYGPSPATVLERFTELTGRMPQPPLWALGYQQSRWSYYPEARVREIANLFRRHRIPCDAIHLDIHYMDGYRCFTWDRSRFPDPAALIDDLHKQGFRVVTLIDCGIKADHSYDVCASGLEGGMFCTYPDGNPAAGPVWPGESYFPDFTAPRVRDWWGDLHQAWVEMGVDGLWNDMNEPTVIGPRGDTLASCVHHDWEGEGADHRRAHNVYGLQMARATYEGLLRLQPERRPFVLTRSGWAGTQRYAASWTADNASTWEHLRLTVPMVLGLGLSGLGFTGPDVGGFSGDADPELLVRWTQLGAFLPLFRNHSARSTKSQEPWVDGEPYLSANRRAIELRYRLLPYMYTAMWQCAQHGHPIARPLFWAFAHDERYYGLQDQFLCGDALLVAPICDPGATSRRVYLPDGDWFDFWSDATHSGPAEVVVPGPLDRCPLFVRAGTVLPMWPLVQHTGEPVAQLILHVYPGRQTSWLYDDDGETMAYRSGGYRVTRFDCQEQGEHGLSVTSQVRGNYRPGYRCWQWRIHGLTEEPVQVVGDGLPVGGTTFSAQKGVVAVETGELGEFHLTS